MFQELGREPFTKRSAMKLAACDARYQLTNRNHDVDVRMDGFELQIQLLPRAHFPFAISAVLQEALWNTCSGSAQQQGYFFVCARARIQSRII